MSLITLQTMKIGIEHHRVLSYDKLFCLCKYDPRATCTNRFTTYFPRVPVIHEFYTNDSYCEYEKDQIPGVINPKLVQKAVTIVSGFSGITTYPQITFCRKHIYDGSLASGFQKTACIASGGVLTLHSGKLVQLDKIYLEQDSSSRDALGRFCVGRQGIPLLEVTTVATELSAAEVVEVLLIIDSCLGRFNNLPHSSFSRRQDINISTPGHPRVEIKGVDTLSLLPELLAQESSRQETAVKVGSDLLQSDTRCANADGSSTHLRTIGLGTRMHLETEIPLQHTLKSIKKEFKSLLPSEIHPLLHNHSIGKKLYNLDLDWNSSDYAILNYLCKSNPSKTAFNLFRGYVEGKYSEYAIKKGPLVNCLSIAELTRLRSDYTSISEFGKRYKNYFPRGYKLT